LLIFYLLIQFVHTLRLDIQHYAIQHATGKRFFAPITEPRRAIDLGTGSGTWILVSICTACIMPITYKFLCRKWLPTFQNVNLLALILFHCNLLLYCRKIAVLNLSMYLKVRTKSTNHIVTFFDYPFAIGIPKPDGWFDYVRQRLLTGAIPANKWKGHIQECSRVCTSDGWIEIIEIDGRIVDGGPACEQFSAWTAEGLKACGIDVNMMQNLDELMHEAGLTNVSKQTFIAPLGSWGEKAGELFAKNAELGISSIQPLFTNALGVPKEEVERIGALMVEEFKSHRAYLNIYAYWGQKK
jgi:PAS domain-containing protein